MSIVDHILIYCRWSSNLLSLIFSLFGVSLALLEIDSDVLLSSHDIFKEKKYEVGRKIVPSCFF